MNYEQSITINCQPIEVYQTYEKVSEWPLWDSDTEAATINGSFIQGATGKIKPKGSPESKMKLTEVTPNRSFTVECALPFCKMHFTHVLNKVDDGTKVINQVRFTGFLAPLFSRLIGKEIKKSIPNSLKGLKEYIEVDF